MWGVSCLLECCVCLMVRMMFAVCMSGGGRMSEKAASVFVVNCVQFAFL